MVLGAGPAGLTLGEPWLMYMHILYEWQQLLSNVVCSIAHGRDTDVRGVCVAGTLLAQMGVTCTIFDKAAGPPTHPAAHLINNRTMEIFRSIWLPDTRSSAPDAPAAPAQVSPPHLPSSAAKRAHGGSTDEGSGTQHGATQQGAVRSLAEVVREAAPPFEHWRRFRYVERLVGGATYGVVDHFSGVRVTHAHCILIGQVAHIDRILCAS